MFVHKHHLRQFLRPEHYSAPAHHALEVQRLFQPAWHPVGVVSQLAKPGASFTFDLFGTPVLVGNNGGTLVAERQQGRWRRDADEPTPLRVGTWGEAVFVSLAPDGPALAEFLEPAREWWGDAFGGPFRFAAAWSGSFACNWKVVIENALETYHVPELHAKTFGDMPPEEDCEHDLQHRYTAFRGGVRNDWVTRRMNDLVRRMGMPVTNYYRHLLVHPHVQFSRLDVYRMVQAVYPTGPASCRYHNFMFTLWGERGGPVRWLDRRFLRWAVMHTARKVFVEDAGVYTAVQRGVTSSPFPGVLGTREERLFAFQEFVLKECGLTAPTDSAPAPAAAPAP